MLVVDGERLGSPRARRAAGQPGTSSSRASTPRASSYARARRRERQRAATRSAAARMRAASPRPAQLDSALVRLARRGRRARRAYRRRPSASASRASRAPARSAAAPDGSSRAVSAGQRQQVEAVVLEHGGERPRVARAHELEVARRNLEAGHVAGPPRAEHLLLERDERTAIRRRHPARHARAPEPPRADAARRGAAGGAGHSSRWKR